MTLHWWMHWFWVTTQFLVILGNPVPSTTAEPRNRMETKDESLSTDTTYRTTRQQSFRIAKAIGLYPQSNTAAMLDRQQITTTSLQNVETSTGVFAGFLGNNSSLLIDRINNATTIPRNMERLRNVVSKKDNKITWIDGANKTSKSKYERDEKQQQQDVVESTEDLTVLPLQEENNKFRLVLNRTRSSSLFSSSSSSGTTRTFNRSEESVQLDEEELVEPQTFATAASILEVGMSRTRSAFPKDFQRDQVQGKPSSEYNASCDKSDSENVNDEYTSSSRSPVDIAAITGSCLATVVLLSTMGSLGFIMYRRRYLNPPQTLNSDKCSNPDSSGYIDDSTIRDNSEEMYSLDNDSFLNSLEAMTIQNYWTDSVKHTKL